MYRLYILQNQWIILALLSGLGSLLLFVLAYLGMWRPREGEGTTTPEPTWRGSLRYIPWFLIFSFIVTIIYNLLYALYTAKYPPNW